MQLLETLKKSLKFFYLGLTQLFIFVTDLLLVEHFLTLTKGKTLKINLQILQNNHTIRVSMQNLNSRKILYKM